MPEEGENMTFQNWHKQQPAPFIIYADFEAPTTKNEGAELNPDQSNTQKMQQHEAYGYMVRCTSWEGVMVKQSLQ